MDEPYSPGSEGSSPGEARSPGGSSPGGGPGLVPDVHHELLLHLHGFAHGLAELGNGWEHLAQRVCDAGCVPCVGRRAHGGDSQAHELLAAPPTQPVQLRVLPPVPLVVTAPQVAVGV